MNKKYLVKVFFSFISCPIILSACTGTHVTECQDCYSTSNQSSLYYIYKNASRYSGKVIGDGHCVSLIKHCSGAPKTNQWRPGQPVWQNNIQSGSIISTFKNDRYPNKTGYHAAIYIEQDSRVIWVWDQWQGKAVHKRLIRWANDDATDSNTAQAYETLSLTKKFLMQSYLLQSGPPFSQSHLLC